jgi:hypothetical protein
MAFQQSNPEGFATLLNEFESDEAASKQAAYDRQSNKDSIAVLHLQLGAPVPAVVPEFCRTCPKLRAMLRNQMQLLCSNAVGFGKPLGESGNLEALLNRVAAAGVHVLPEARFTMLMTGLQDQVLIMRHLGAHVGFTVVGATGYWALDNTARERYGASAGAHGLREAQFHKDVCVMVKWSWQHGHCVIFFKCGQLAVGLTGLIAHDSESGLTTVEQGEARCSRISMAHTLFYLQTGQTDPHSQLEEVVELKPGWIVMCPKAATSPVKMAQPFGDWLCDLPPGLEERSMRSLDSAAGAGADQILLNMRENPAISIDSIDTQTAQSSRYFQCGCGRRVRLHEKRLRCKLPWKNIGGDRACSPACLQGEGAVAGGASGTSGMVEDDEIDDGANDVIGVQDDDEVQFLRVFMDVSGD